MYLFQVEKKSNTSENSALTGDSISDVHPEQTSHSKLSREKETSKVISKGSAPLFISHQSADRKAGMSTRSTHAVRSTDADVSIIKEIPCFDIDWSPKRNDEVGYFFVGILY